LLPRGFETFVIHCGISVVGDIIYFKKECKLLKDDVVDQSADYTEEKSLDV
jgi:hypothetical protein